MTNAEWIRGMPDDELADFLMSINAMGHNGYDVSDYSRDYGMDTFEWVRKEHTNTR